MSRFFKKPSYKRSVKTTVEPYNYVSDLDPDAFVVTNTSNTTVTNTPNPVTNTPNTTVTNTPNTTVKDMPANTGAVWSDEEVIKLLKSIKKKKPIEDIAVEHERTVKGIHYQLQRLAADYSINDGRTIEEIMLFTSLTQEEVEAAIAKKTKQMANKEKYLEYKKSTELARTLVNPNTTVTTTAATAVTTISPNISDTQLIINMLTDIQNKLNILIG